MSQFILTSEVGSGLTSYQGENVAATSCGLALPTGVQVDSSNMDIYVSDLTSFRVMVVTRTTGLVSTFAGKGVQQYSGDNGPATAASFTDVDGLLLSSGVLYVTDNGGHRIRSVFTVQPSLPPTIAPSVTPSVSPSCSPSLLPTNSPTISPTVMPTVVPTLVPSAKPSLLPSVLPSTSPSVAPFTLPSVNPSTLPTLSPTISPSAAPSCSPSVMPTAAPSTVRSSSNYIQTVMGTTAGTSSGSGGLATAAAVNYPQSVWQDTLFYVYVVERSGRCVRRFNIADNIVLNFAGVCGSSQTLAGNGGPATSALLASPIDVRSDTAGKVFICDFGGFQVRTVVSGVINAFAGTGVATSSGNSIAATSAGISEPYGSWIGTDNTFYLADYLGNKIRKVDGSNILTTFAGRDVLNMFIVIFHCLG